MSDDLSVDSILGENGRVAARLDRYEVRQQQLTMARTVADALRSKQHLIAEAGTGTGKSFAYLVPSILHATQDQAASIASDSSDPSRGGDNERNANAKPRRVLVSTHTISLQEQLIAKDVPLLNAVIPREFSAVLVKGRSNYLSIRRMERAISKATTLLSTDQQHDQLRRIQAWSKETDDGSLSTLPIRPDGQVWDEVKSDTSNCLGRRCRHHQDCFYFKARRRAHNAQLMIVNHALFFSDLALRREGASILPDYDAVVLDECHTIESVAGDHLGIRLTSGQFDYLFNQLYNDQTQKGLLVEKNLTKEQKMVERCQFAAANLFADLLDWWDNAGSTNGRVNHPDVVDNPLSDAMEALGSQLQAIAKSCKAEAEKKDFESVYERTMGLAASLRRWIRQEVEESVYWVERSKSARGSDRVTLSASPIHVGQTLRESLYQSDSISSVVMTSATLATADDDFSFFRSRIGLTASLSVRVGSPFDYQQQAKLVIVNDLPDPSRDRDAFERALPEQVKRFVGHTKGHAFVLFTSYSLLRSCATAMSHWLTQRAITLYAQGGKQSRTQLLDAFRRAERGVLFGTDSFWQGVDVPGDALTNVVITKLPFAVPSHPLMQARLEAIKRSGGNPFSEYQLPEAIIKFRQGFGRLVRTRDDRGMVVVLDPRVTTKPYGRMFVRSLPEMPVHIVSAQRRPKT